MPTGRKALEKVVLEQISQFELIDCWVRDGWDEVSSDLINLALKREVLEGDIVLEAIHQRLLLIGGINYRQHVELDIRINDITSAHALAYAAQHSTFSPSQLAKIKYDDESQALSLRKKVQVLKNQIFDQLCSWESKSPDIPSL